MKKFVFIAALVCLAFLAWTVSCQSPSTTGNPAASNTPNNDKSSLNNDSSDKDAGTAMGALKIIIKDAPVENVEKVLVVIDDVRVHRVGETEGESFFPVWQNPAGTEYDLLSMKTTPIILTTALPAGAYNQIRMSILSGNLLLLGNTQRYPLKVPSDEIKIHYQFEVPEGGTAVITLDFNLEESLHIEKRGKKDSYNLRPVVNVVGFEQGI